MVVPLRRLAHDEYAFTLNDLLSNAQAKAEVNQAVATFAADPVSLGFRNSAAFLEVKGVQAQAYFDAAEAVATKAVADLPALGVCTTPSEATCAQRFITTFGRRLYRRALSTGEQAAYTKVYADARTRGDAFATSIGGVVTAFLLSPHFLYRVELDDAGSGPVRPVSQLELAARLSYLFWRSAPDEQLLTAAEQGRLDSPAAVEAEARRLLADAKGRRMTQFFGEWLNVDELSGLRRNATFYPGLNPELPQLLATEVESLVRDVLWSGDGKLSTLLTAPYTFMNPALATHYGYTGVTGSGWSKVAYHPGRAGLLMTGGVVINHDKEARSSIVNRGLRMRTDVFCAVVQAPPNNIPSLEAIEENQTQAARLAQHRTDASCNGCHKLMDPLGEPFESIDAVGRERTRDERGFELTFSSTLTSTDVDGPVAGPVELVSRLAQSNEVSSCFVTQLSRFARGMKETSASACSDYRLMQSFRASQGDIRELLIAFTQTDDFLYRSVGEL